MRAAIIAAFLILGACNTQAQSTAHDNVIRSSLEFTNSLFRLPDVSSAGLNETADLGSGLTVKPLSVIEDSRCPEDVTCVWAGRLRLRAIVSWAEAELTLGQPFETPHGVVVFTIAAPPCFAHWPEGALQPAYRFGFRRQ